MFLKRNIIYLYFIFFLFQNCAPFEAFDDGAIYPYSSKPVFFSDIKLISTEVDSDNRETFTFDAVFSYAPDPAQNLGYRIDFSTLTQVGACSFDEGILNNTNNHIEVSCTLAVEDDLYVRFLFRGINGEEESREFRF